MLIGRISVQFALTHSKYFFFRAGRAGLLHPSGTGFVFRDHESSTSVAPASEAMYSSLSGGSAGSRGR